MAPSSQPKKKTPSQAERRLERGSGWHRDEEEPSEDPWGTIVAVGISLFLVLLLCAITYFIGWARSLPFFPPH